MAHFLLIGLRGSGKTTIAQQLASQLDMPWLDLDDRVRDALEAPSIQHAWVHYGEPKFREIESQQLDLALAEPDSIIALGGGTPTAPGASELLRKARADGSAVIYYLRAPPDMLRQRLAETVGSTDIQRPSLTGKGMLEEIDEIYIQRDPLYRKLASAIIDAPNSIDSTIKSILNHLSENNLLTPRS